MISGTSSVIGMILGLLSFKPRIFGFKTGSLHDKCVVTDQTILFTRLTGVIDFLSRIFDLSLIDLRKFGW